MIGHRKFECKFKLSYQNSDTILQPLLWNNPAHGPASIWHGYDVSMTHQGHIFNTSVTCFWHHNGIFLTHFLHSSFSIILDYCIYLYFIFQHWNMFNSAFLKNLQQLDQWRIWIIWWGGGAANHHFADLSCEKIADFFIFHILLSSHLFSIIVDISVK